MELGHLAKDKADNLFAACLQTLLKNQPEHYAATLAVKHCLKRAVGAKLLANGAFNVCFRITFEDGQHVVVRFTSIGRVVARHEKVNDEVAIMNFWPSTRMLQSRKYWAMAHATCWTQMKKLGWTV